MKKFTIEEFRASRMWIGSYEDLIAYVVNRPKLRRLVFSCWNGSEIPGFLYLIPDSDTSDPYTIGFDMKSGIYRAEFWGDFASGTNLAEIEEKLYDTICKINNW